MKMAINDYERVIKGEETGRAYLLNFIDTHQMTDDEILYVVYMAAESVCGRPQENINI